MPDTVMTLVERLRNPAWETNPNGGDALLNVKQTREVMDEAADTISLVWAVIRDAARVRDA